MRIKSPFGAKIIFNCLLHLSKFELSFQKTYDSAKLNEHENEKNNV